MDLGGGGVDFDKELQMVGLSNIASGLTGGFTGSYIISATTLTMRAGVKSRLCGFVTAGAEMLIFALPFSPVCYLPRAFFGGILIFIAADLMIEWLGEAAFKMESAEYAVSLFTFGICLAINLEAGIGAGVMAALINFVLAFSSASQFIRKRERVHSAVTRSLRSRRYLSGRQDEICCFELSGFLFFGSTMQIKAVVSEAVQIEVQGLPQHSTDYCSVEGGGRRG